ncbi:IS200/IS605 family accessory protein TnpB-related protein [Nocardiopsis halotolerans]|uniref:IS200/IS605 family accessory protein TnpB-related protein n=1 Tax=Nocardiopsis halotolerans TaxID=124252 RepID=UPI0003696629|nr:IS200/IS605 family accessory protein TnpB-related protein [Nocardiopsis halotolerans]
MRPIQVPYLVPAPTGVSVRDRLTGLTGLTIQDETVLREVDAYLGSLASTDLATRCSHGTDHDKDTWAARKRELTPVSSARWAGTLTKTSNEQWALARRGHHDVDRGRWYVTASWTHQAVPQVPWETALARGVVGVDMNADHLAAWRLDTHGNPVGDPHRFDYDLSGTSTHRDAQVRHALSQLLWWATGHGVAAIAVEDLDFHKEKTREKHGRRKKFRQVISGMPTARLRSRLTSMAHAMGIAVIAVDAAYTSRWGAAHWQKPLTSNKRQTSRHAAAVAIGRRAQGHAIRRRTAPPHDDQSDRRGHRTAQAGPRARGREGTRRPATDRAQDARRRAGTARTRATSASSTVRDARYRDVAPDVTPGHRLGTVSSPASR